MSRWARGEADVEQLIARREMDRTTGAQADGTALLEQARKTAATAARLAADDPYSSYVLAYDSARFACTALLAQQGLRATTNGGHYAVERAVRAQFGDGFRIFGTAATSWSIPACPQTQPPTKKPCRQRRTRSALSLPQPSSFLSCPASASSRDRRRAQKLPRCPPVGRAGQAHVAEAETPLPQL
jgi:hypothetical protein